MTPTAWVLLGMVVAWSLGGGLAFRLGHLRRTGRWYGDERLPGIVRFLPLQLIPLGSFLALIGVAAALAPAEDEPASPVGLAFFFASFVALGWWLWTMGRPARMLKPAWMRRLDDETREHPEVPVR